MRISVMAVSTRCAVYIVTSVLMLASLILPGAKALPINGEEVHAPYTRCGANTCDLRTHYCDTVAVVCTSCQDTCQPSRINGDNTAINRCRKNCEWFYVFSTTPAPAPASTQIPPTTRAGQQTQQNALFGYLEKASAPLLIVILFVCVVIILALVALLACVLRRRTWAQHRRRNGAGGRNVVCEDGSDHCRSVDDARRLPINKTPLTTSLSAPTDAKDGGAATQPKFWCSGADTEAPRHGGGGSLPVAGANGAAHGSLQPLLNSSP